MVKYRGNDKNKTQGKFAELTGSLVEPIWGGERVSDGNLSVCKITFGAEPIDYKIFKWVQHEERKLVKNTEVGTKSQQALKL